MQGASQRNTQKIQSNKLVSLNLTQPVQADLYSQGQFLLQNQNMKHNVNITNQHRKLTQLQNRDGQFMMNQQGQDPYGRAISNPQQQSRQLINSSASNAGPTGLTGINESSRNAPLQQLQKKQNSLGASFNRSGLITGASNLTVSGQLKSQAYSNSQIQNMKGIPTVIQGSGIPQI